MPCKYSFITFYLILLLQSIVDLCNYHFPLKYYKEHTLPEYQISNEPGISKRLTAQFLQSLTCNKKHYFCCENRNNKNTVGFWGGFVFGQKHLIHNTSLTDQRSKKKREKQR